MGSVVESFVSGMNDILSILAGFLWGPWVFYAVLLLGIIATVGTRFIQFRILTHGVGILTGKYDDENDPGTINHFQALAAALSATVGLGNIGGVAIAIGLGGPGTLFWMWVVAVFGMALKAVEITIAMMFRDTSDEELPRGGSMYVIRETLGKKAGVLGFIGKSLAVLFSASCAVQVFTGGNIFQVWNVAVLTKGYFRVPELVTSAILAFIVGLVVLGGIKRIGKVASRLVPFMVLLYIATGLVIVAMNIEAVPSMLMLIVRSAFDPAEAGGAFLGAGIYFAFSQGMRRAIFSNEAGQGTAPLVHAAAKTDHPAREGIVGGLGPFIDTIVICTLTALVILLSGAWNNPGVGNVDVPLEIQQSQGEDRVTPEDANLPQWGVVTETGDSVIPLTSLPSRERDWEAGDAFFLKATTDGLLRPHNGGHSRIQLMGHITTDPQTPTELVAVFDRWQPQSTQWDQLPESVTLDDQAVFIPYEGAELTAFAFDQNLPGLGKWLVTLAAWLFSISTMISYSFYGEQGIGYFNRKPGTIRAFRIVFILVAAAAPFLAADIDTLLNIIDVGSGLMIWANIPILFITGWLGVRALNRYFEEGGHNDISPRG